MRTHKGQYSSVDAMVGLAGLSFVMMLSIYLVSHIYSDIAGHTADEDAKIRAFYALGQIMSPGEPANWHLSSAAAVSYGIGDGESVINPAKLSALSSANRTEVAERLGIAGWNYSLSISDLANGSLVYSDGANASQNAVLVRQVSTMNGENVLVELTVSR